MPQAVEHKAVLREPRGDECRPPRRRVELIPPQDRSPATVEHGRSRCEVHGGGSWARVDPIAKGRYGAEWQRVRQRVLREEPTCRICGAPSSDVDHIVAVADGGGMYDRANLRSLCADCHKRHTSEQNAQRRRKSDEGAWDANRN